MSCKFSIPFSGSPEAILSKAKSAISGAGGTFISEGQEGRFELPVPMGKVAGEYLLSENDLIITISRKPIFISCNLIEHKLNEYLNPSV